MAVFYREKNVWSSYRKFINHVHLSLQCLLNLGDGGCLTTEFIVAICLHDRFTSR